MIKTQIKKNGIESNVGYHDTQEQADTWLANEIANESFGKNDRWVREGNEDISGATDTRVVVDMPGRDAVYDENGVEISPAIPEVNHLEYFLPKTYEVTTEDITEEIEENKKQEKRVQRISKGQNVLAFIIRLNEKKYAAGEFTIADLMSLEDYAPILKIERQIMRGTLPTAKQSLQNYAGLYYNQSDINKIIAKIDLVLGT